VITSISEECTISIFRVALKMEVIHSCETLVTTCKTGWFTTQKITINKSKTVSANSLLKYRCVMLIAKVGGNCIVTMRQGTYSKEFKMLKVAPMC